MKMIKKTETQVQVNQDTPVLVCYWFISNKNNAQLFKDLQNIRSRISKQDLHIVCLNPFNSQEDIDQYKFEMDLDLDMQVDSRNSTLFYQISSYPTFMLIAGKGKILMRQNGYTEEGIYEVEELIKLSHKQSSYHENSKGRIISLNAYKDNLSLQFKKI